jgi:hypothetical protein
MPPSWKEENFALIDEALIDEEWDEETIRREQTVTAVQPVAALDSDETEEASTTTNSDNPQEEVLFAPLHRDVLASLRPPSGVLLDGQSLIIQQPLSTNMRVPPQVQSVYIVASALGTEVELSHSNYTDGNNHLILSLNNGCELVFVEHFNSYGIGRRVLLAVGVQPLDENAQEQFRSGLVDASSAEAVLVSSLPENFAAVSTVQRQLERYAAQLLHAESV